MRKIIVISFVVILLVVFIFSSCVDLDKPPIRPHEDDVIFDGYTIVALVCYNCGVTFELGNGYYISGRIHCNHCYEIIFIEKKKEEQICS